MVLAVRHGIWVDSKVSRELELKGDLIDVLPNPVWAKEPVVQFLRVSFHAEVFCRKPNLLFYRAHWLLLSTFVHMLLIVLHFFKVSLHFILDVMDVLY